VFKDGEPVP